MQIQLLFQNSWMLCSSFLSDYIFLSSLHLFAFCKVKGYMSNPGHFIQYVTINSNPGQSRIILDNWSLYLNHICFIYKKNALFIYFVSSFPRRGQGGRFSSPLVQKSRCKWNNCKNEMVCHMQFLSTSTMFPL